jgi:hypothetical protein
MAVRLMSTTTTEATTVVEYGVQYTWPDGHTETRAKESRHSAEIDVRMGNRRGDKTAELVRREVTTTAWEVAQ